MANCEMIVAHHSDCECPICKAHQDDTCDKPSVGFTKQLGDLTDRCEVCEEHAVMAAGDPEAYGVLTCYSTDGAQAVRARRTADSREGSK